MEWRHFRPMRSFEDRRFGFPPLPSALQAPERFSYEAPGELAAQAGLDHIPDTFAERFTGSRMKPLENAAPQRFGSNTMAEQNTSTVPWWAGLGTLAATPYLFQAAEKIGRGAMKAAKSPFARSIGVGSLPTLAGVGGVDRNDPQQRAESDEFNRKFRERFQGWFGPSTPPASTGRGIGSDFVAAAEEPLPGRGIGSDAVAAPPPQEPPQPLPQPASRGIGSDFVAAPGTLAARPVPRGRGVDLPRPAAYEPQAPAAPEQMPWWLRNALLQREAPGGAYLNPEAAARAERSFG